MNATGFARAFQEFPDLPHGRIAEGPCLRKPLTYMTDQPHTDRSQDI
jgi:hypothetical protein